MIKTNLKIIFTLLMLLLLTSCFNNNENKKEISYKNQIENIEEKNILNSFSLLWWEIEQLKKEFWEITSSWNLVILNESIKNNDFKEIQKIIPIIIDDYKNNKEKLTKEDKEKIKSLKYSNISAILNDWNYFYKEQEKSKEAIKYIEEFISVDPDFVDPFYNNYYLWYSNEIIKNYTWALNYYNKALDFAWNSEKNKKLKSIILNQIWHLYDLKWDLEKAYSFYYKSYFIYKLNSENLINLWRYFVRKNNFELAKTYFESAINLSNNNLLKSEIYYNLSSISLYSNIENKLNISLDYANKSIEYNKNSPLWYLWKARIFILKWENLNEAENIFKKSIEIYPDFSTAYEWLWILEQWRWFYNKSVTYFLKSIETIPNDIILMDNERNNNLARVNYLLSVSLALWKNKEMAIKHLNQMFILKDDISLAMFINEINKKDYWNFSYMKWYEEFEKIVSLLK